ncbi:MAG: trehalose-6-phosphate synthase [Rhodothermales bacterium]
MPLPVSAGPPPWSHSDPDRDSDQPLPDSAAPVPTTDLGRLVVVANRAPVREEDGEWQPSIGGLATALLPVLEQHGGVWVSMQEDDAPEHQPYPADEPQFTIRRVPMSEDERANYYEGMANSVLWPVSHYLLQHLALERAFIEDYRRINRRFADAVLDEAEPDDTIWVQDYHLMLLPGYVREKLPDARIAHFWHIPWPAMEVFRILPWARELVRGLLGCDFIGFHVQEYVDNFRETARTLLGAELTDGGVRWEGREVRVEAHPIGIDVGYFEETARSEETARQAERLRAESTAELLLVGVDRLDYTKGIPARLQAFELFLERNPEYRGRVSLYQIATPSRTGVESYQELKREVDEVVGRINGAFSEGQWVPVHYYYRSFAQDELCAYYRAADAALITPLRDGMNLVAHEFVAANERGALVLSEMAGAAYLLSGALLVNPYDEDGLASTIKSALEMEPEEKRLRMDALKAHVADLDVHRWADRFLASFVAPSS